MRYYTPIEQLTRQDTTKENIKAIALSVVIGCAFAALLFFQLSK